MAGGTLGSLINKQALANTPKEVLNRYVFFIAFIISFSGGLHGANTSNVSGILAVSEGHHMRTAVVGDGPQHRVNRISLTYH
jgi:hypothetical protein